jgi:hypothetical protein
VSLLLTRGIILFKRSVKLTVTANIVRSSNHEK